MLSVFECLVAMLLDFIGLEKTGSWNLPSYGRRQAAAVIAKFKTNAKPFWYIHLRVAKLD